MTPSDYRRLSRQLEELSVSHAALAAAQATQAAQAAARIEELLAQVDWFTRAHAELTGRVETFASIDSVSRLIRHAPLRDEPLVSVVLPTFHRPDHLRRAIASVIDQRYTQWELIVVDDGGDSNSRAVAVEAADPRITWAGIPHAGVCAARNTALAMARGGIVAYIDDDNIMDPDWLRAVVWAFEQRPEVDVLYGAFVVDDVLRVDGGSSGQMPRTFLHRWDREALKAGNLADMGAIAHRSGLPDAKFDESLTQMGDWDLLVRLTRERDPLVLPVIACYYMTDAPNRLTCGETRDADHERVRTRAAAVEA